MTDKGTNSGDTGKDKLLTAAFIGFGILVFCYVASHVPQEDHSTEGNTDTGQTTRAPEANTWSSQPPSIVRDRVDDLAVRRANRWLDKNDGSTNTVTGTDASGRTIVELTYGANQDYQGHYVFQYYSSPNQGRGVTTVQIEKFEPTGAQSPGIFQNRCVGSTSYDYDGNGRLVSAKLMGNFNSLESSVYLDYDQSGNVTSIRRGDYQGQSTPIVNPTQQEIIDNLSTYYFAESFAVNKIR